MISIVVPAHNESSVIARTLSAWTGDSGPDEIDVVVVCNGCTDNTASIARQFGPMVRVCESEVASKAYALNLGDQISRAFPRIYVDADIVISVRAIRTLARHLEGGNVLAVAPTPEINLAGCSWLVRKYYGVRSRLPSSHEGIGGSGVYALSEVGRKRFPQFPEIIADDTYVRLQFKPEERETLSSVKSMVFPPRTIPQLLAIRTRAYAGTVELDHQFPELRANKGKTNNRALIALFKELRLWPGLLVYCYVNILARCRTTVRSRTASYAWQRDETSRAALFPDSRQ
jgi:glycosyltransferase involved in cell wall biosynthesis